MMMTHTWIDQYSWTAIGEFLREKVASAVNFDCGDVDEIPRAKGGEWADARAPFPTTLLQFATPNSPVKSHALILWYEADNGGVSIIAAERLREGHEWRTTLPFRVTRKDDGSFHFEGVAPRQYLNMFTPSGERKDGKTGKAVKVNFRDADKKIPEYLDDYRQYELKVVEHLVQVINELRSMPLPSGS